VNVDVIVGGIGEDLGHKGGVSGGGEGVRARSVLNRCDSLAIQERVGVSHAKRNHNVTVLFYVSLVNVECKNFVFATA